MTSISVERLIDAPPERVFLAASDFAGAPGRIKGIVKVEVLTNGPVGKGTRFRETRKFLGREASEEMEVIEFEPPRRYLLGAESHGCRYRTEFAFVPTAAGTTVRMTFGAEPLTFFSKVMTVLMRPLMKKMVSMCAKDLDDLKSHLESGK